MSDSYESDILAWSEHQAALLRRAAGGENVQGIDWANVVEEIESVGRSELHAVQEHLVNTMLHLLRLRAWLQADAARHWRVEILAFRRNARRRFTPSMRQRINLDELYDEARESFLTLAYDLGSESAPSPARCPFALDDLLGEKTTEKLLATVSHPAKPDRVPSAEPTP